ncbi:hypothetical protein [Nocardiopsis sp. NRRL B-16309]|uniref:hypothetical protein n=1 Tax=Nocardiopsis sp. NRRL B-16309 TaxID=1519494 RepID=UPI0006AE747D|nr:hypothetical protein [Nocardiopsis sp. NRRL B-16309]KOX19659.1 hypothetical protein ADL05_05910 [Nocardiopsis sp. NRRL B-16309]
MTERIFSVVHDCLDWARALDPPLAPDPDALLFLLTAHLDAGSPDPMDWSVSDVDDIARTVQHWTGVSGDLRPAWLTWCDFLVDTGQLVCTESPRRLRSAIATVDLEPGGPEPDSSEPDGPAHRPDPVEEGALPLLHRLGAGEDGEPEPLRPVLRTRPGDLDAAARSCAVLADAARLTVWADRGLDLDPDRDDDALTAADTEEAAAALDLDPDRVRELFAIARDAGLLRTTYTRVLPGPTARAWADGEPGAVADAWAGALLAMTRLRGMAAFLVLTNLFVCGDLRTPAEVVDAYGPAVVLGDHGTDPEQAVRRVLETLAELGAVARDGPGFRTTPLGDHFMVGRLRHSGARVPLTPTVGAMSADEALALVEQGRPVDTATLLERWTAARDTATAARQLWEAGAAPESWRRRARVAAHLSVLEADLFPMLSLYTHHPVLGGWARRLLGAAPEPPTSHQAAWVVLDDYALLLDAGLPLPVEDGERYAPHARDFARAVWLTGHPVADAVLARCAEGALGGEVAEAARSVLEHQLVGQQVDAR